MSFLKESEYDGNLSPSPETLPENKIPLGCQVGEHVKLANLASRKKISSDCMNACHILCCNGEHSKLQVCLWLRCSLHLKKRQLFLFSIILNEWQQKFLYLKMADKSLRCTLDKQVLHEMLPFYYYYYYYLQGKKKNI